MTLDLSTLDIATLRAPLPATPLLGPAPLVLATARTAARLAPADGSDAAVARQTSAAALAAALSARSSAWADRVEFRPESRWTALLPTSIAAEILDPALHDDLARAQIWLLSWLPGQGTRLHDHGGSAGAFAVVAGELTERTVTGLASVEGAGAAGRTREATTTLTAGRVRPFGPHHVHQVTNTATVPAVSVHVYTSGLTVMNTYTVTAAGLLLQTGTERAGVDW